MHRPFAEVVEELRGEPQGKRERERAGGRGGERESRGERGEMQAAPRDVYGFRALETGVFSEVGVEKEEAVIREAKRGLRRRRLARGRRERGRLAGEGSQRETGGTVLWTADPAIVGIMKPRRDFSLFSRAVKRYLE